VINSPLVFLFFLELSTRLIDELVHGKRGDMVTGLYPSMDPIEMVAGGCARLVFGMGRGMEKGKGTTYLMSHDVPTCSRIWAGSPVYKTNLEVCLVSGFHCDLSRK
jgi:hypothetical protein